LQMLHSITEHYQQQKSFRTTTQLKQDSVYNMATQYANGKIVTDGLVLCLDAADRNSYVSGSTTWFNMAGSNNGTLTNGPTFNTGSGGNIVFDGVDDYVNLGKPAVLDLTTLTLSAWVRTTTSANQIVIGKSYLSSYYMNISPNAKTFSFWTNGSTLPSTTVSTIGNPIWCNIVGTINSISKNIYFNGIINSSTVGSVVGIDNNDVYIGNSPVLNNPFIGNIANIQIYNRALSADEVLQNYNAQKSRFGL